MPNPSRDRSGQPVVGAHTRTVQDGRKTSRSQEIDVNSFHEETVSSDRSGQPVVEINTENVPDGCETRSCHESMRLNVEDETLRERSGQPVVNHDDSSHEQTMLTEVNMYFQIPGLPHSVVKHAQSTSVRELVQKIENHPNRHALQQDLRQNQAYNPFSPESKQMIQDVGNVELFELIETDPKTQCKACLSYWSEDIVYCTCGHLLNETVANRIFIVYTLDLLSIPEYVIKKGRHHGHRHGKAPENQEYHLAHNLKRDAKRGTTKESMIDSCEIMFSVNGWSKTNEMKKFVAHGTFLQNKITPTDVRSRILSLQAKLVDLSQ